MEGAGEKHQGLQDWGAKGASHSQDVGQDPRG